MKTYVGAFAPLQPPVGYWQAGRGAGAAARTFAELWQLTDGAWQLPAPSQTSVASVRSAIG
jgi:hypothetical protein